MDNPFRYSGVVTGDRFVDREEEIAALHRGAAEGVHLFLYSPRRYGKTSLLAETIRRLPAGVKGVHVDVSTVLSLQALVELLAGEVVRGTTSSLARVRKWARAFLGGLRPRVVVDSTGRVAVEVEFEPRVDDPATLDEALALPQRVAEDLGVRLLVAWDEFPFVAELGGSPLIRAMRAAFQVQDRVSHVFAGSQTAMMETLFAAERSPFFRMGRPLRLGPVPREAFVPFLVAGFARGEMNLSPALAAELCARVGDHPYFVQTVAHELWARGAVGGGKITEGDLGAALEVVVGWHGAFYRRVWERLTVHQRRVVQALVMLGEGAPLFAADTVRRFGLKSPSHVQRALEGLLREEILDKRDGDYAWADPLFPHWVRGALGG